MMRSLSMAIASLRNHQTYMDVISSNIANVNTTGYKMGRVQFQELLSQTIRGSSAPRGGLGGLNPVQISLGMALGGIDTFFTQGSLKDTGRLTDLAIQGEGFFVLGTGDTDGDGVSDGYAYARDGNLDVGLDGSLVHLTTGLVVQGWSADPNTGVIDTTEPIGNISVPLGQRIARATSFMTLIGNVNSDAVVGDSTSSRMSMYDSLGTEHEIMLTLTKSSANTWDWDVSDPNAGTSQITGISNNSGTVTFDANGVYLSSTPAGNTTPHLTFSTGADPADVDMQFNDITQLVGYGDIGPSNQDGLPPGALTTFTMAITGEVNGVYSNGLTRRLGQLSIAKFLNSGGLQKKGQSLFSPSANSGAAQIGLPGQDGRGQISSGYLEMSNVDLAQQFTDMIVAQRGFQANSRVITASDEMLQELVNLVR